MFWDLIMDEFGESIFDVLGNVVDGVAEIFGAVGTEGHDALPGSAVELSGGADALSYQPQDPSGSGFVSYQPGSYTEWDGGIAGDRFDPPPAKGPYSP